MGKINTVCRNCNKAAKALAKRLGKEGYCTKHCRIELEKERQAKLVSAA